MLQVNPNHADALHLSGVMAHQHNDNDRAVSLIRRAIDISPQNALYYSNLGAILQRQGKTEEEIACYRKAIEANPKYPDAYCNLGLALKARGKSEEAMSMFQKAVELNPNYANAYNGMGMVRMEQSEEAVMYFQKAVQLNPNYADAYYNLANALAADHEQAIACYRKTLELEPNHGRAFTNLFHRLLCACSWDGLGEFFAASEARLETWLKDASRTPVQPLMSLIQHPNPAKNLAIAQSWAKDVVNRVSDLTPRPPSLKGKGENSMKRPSPFRGGVKKIRVGYLSNDFRNHPVAHLISGVFRLHNRNEFEIYCYSYGQDDGSLYRQKIRQDCDCFVDLQHVGHAESAQRIYEDQIDILVDLMGFTKGGRLEICALRPAPIQVNYLGYPGTCGADFFDYIIIDKTIVPPEHAPYYTEKSVYMPHSYQANDNRQAFSDKPMSRKDFGISENRFVFCSFNQVHKIEPMMFNVWMSILRRIPESVLWLLPGSPLTETNLRREAANRGVDPARLIFSERLDKPDHLSRHTLADLALDTRIYNGHTTTSDALWAGIPVVALLGTHFASRVSASLLKAVGLSGLVTRNLEEYEKLAVRLAKQPGELIKIRQQLAKNRLTEPLFDTPRFTKDLETAYKEMYRRWQHGEMPGVIGG
ncbi:MAG: hypothetical protein BWK80_55555 [Desulfobacteraceae bacterium IS3]|nr:MAG: hypothetical protein BWK80_55555 [Desulfobacteraceae bacterium IS3]